MMHCFAVLLSLLCLKLSLVAGQADSNYCGPPRVNKTIIECPVGWYRYESRCYYLQQFPLKNRADAASECQTKNSLLLRVDTATQFEFLTQWLDDINYDKKQPLHTSGMLSPSNRFQFIWQGYASASWRTEMMLYWLSEYPREGDGKPPEDWNGLDTVLLGNNGAKWGWILSNNSVELPFICESDINVLQASLPPTRGFDYGVPNINEIQRSPCIQKEPEDVLLFTGGRSQGSNIGQTAEFECIAYGNPPPTYRWFKYSAGGSIEQEIFASNDSRYSLTNGKLTIYATESKDGGEYGCLASNDLGSVLSKRAKLEFGQMPTFSKQEQQRVIRNEYQYASLQCATELGTHREEFVFQFFYSQDGNSINAREVRPDFRNNLFVSQANGLIYFSEATRNDQGTYFCRVGAKSQSSERLKGPDIELVINQASADYNAIIIADGFPASVPKDPLAGDDVRLECVAQGAITPYDVPLEYEWTRDGGLEIPGKARFVDDYKRALLIPNAQPADGGTYSCVAIDGQRKRSERKSLSLSITSPPKFMIRPQNKFADIGSTVSFMCQATGTGNLQYTWLYGSKHKVDNIAAFPSIANSGRITWNNMSNPRILTITNVQTSDAGTYGCRVLSNHGTVFSFAQLKVLSMAPSFVKNPSARVSGLLSSTVFLPCDVEGAPEPTRTWLKDNSPISVTRCVNSNEKVCEMVTGKLRITSLTVNDAGLYHCVGENSLGKANGSVVLTVANQLTMQFSPENRIALINSTIDLPCQLRNDAPNLDINYAWMFESTDIKFGRYDFDARRYEATQFYRPYKKDFGTLRISNIQYDFEGNYTCIAQTPLGELRKWAYVRVAGPPGPCAGVEVNKNPNNSIRVRWHMGATHTQPITSYVIELLMVIENKWHVHSTVEETMGGGNGNEDETLREATISGLPFFHSYKLRVSAVNMYGRGEPSPASDQFVTAYGPPSRVPLNVTGGGGKVKTLVVRWRQIDEAYQGSAFFRYEVQYKLASDTESNFNNPIAITGTPVLGVANHLEHAIMLSGRDVFFQKYQVRIRGVSYSKESMLIADRMPGNWSEIVEIYSAERVPQSSPTNIRALAFNSTAVDVFWDPPANYDGVSGNILGYRIVYWPKLTACEIENNRDKVQYSQRQTLFGKATSGQVIGLKPDTFYCFSVQLFNSAGDSPEGGWRDVTTNKLPPSDYPTNVVVHSTGQFSTIRVTWNGVRQAAGEESVDGYMVRYWITGAPATNFTEVDAGMANEAVVRKLSNDVRYDLRVYAYSAGGIGSYSSPMIQFMIIPKDRCVPGASWEAPDIKYVFVCSSCRTLATGLLAAACALLATAISYLL